MVCTSLDRTLHERSQPTLQKKRFIYVNLAYIIIYFNFSILKLVYCPSINNIDRFWTKKQHEMKHSTTYVNGF